MSNLLKKFVFSFFSFLILFSSIAPNLLVARAQSPIRCGLLDESCCNLAGGTPDQCQTGLKCQSGKCVSDGSTENLPVRGQVTQPNNSNSGSTSGPDTGSWYNQDFWSWHQKVYSEETSPGSEIFGERYTAAQVQWVVYGLISLILHSTGEKGTEALICLQQSDISGCADKIKAAVDSLTQTSDTTPSGETGINSSVLSFFDTKPISGIRYVHEKINKFRLIPEAQAQGFGFTAASPVQRLWSAFRDLSFGLIVIIALIMAFMIMFRVKISPQIIITLQSSIPKIIGALIFITFSYAIAGFMIDLMYVIMGFLAAFLSNSAISTMNAPDIFNSLNNGNILSLSLLYLFYFISGITSFLVGSAPNLYLAAGAFVLSIFLGVIFLIVAVLVLFVSIIKILWLLLKTYANIILQIALGPLQILIGTITPFGGVGGWLKSLISNLAVFPVVSFMYVLSFFFLAQAFTTAFPPVLYKSLQFPFGIDISILPEIQSSWSPPLTFGAGAAGILWLGASLVIMTLIPKSAEIIQAAISGKPFAYGTAIGEAFGPVITGGYGAANYQSSRQAAKYSAQQKYVAETPGATMDPRIQRTQDIWSVIRGISGGKIK